ncbi:MAG: recombination protein O N-terminal domain-containing protein [Proteiniphilum sp.]|jgi:DNA repair protein RecO (recombination protein O)|nr:recombination protein O N-terminal domain-containing protein [Proteiniphilum sp.]
MLHKTEGIVLGTTSYSDAYSIAHLFTRDFGRISYLLPVSRGKRSRIRNALFFPLSVLYLEVEHIPLRDIQRLKEAERQFPLYALCTDMTKVSLAFFISEFLSCVLRESNHSEWTFDYLKNSVETLEVAEKGLANFHLALMMGLTRFLGISPNMEFSGEQSFFDLQNGEFVENEPLHSHYLHGSESACLRDLSRMNYANMHLFGLSRNSRNVIADLLLDYYRLHICNFPPLKSLEILREIG